MMARMDRFSALSESAINFKPWTGFRTQGFRFLSELTCFIEDGYTLVWHCRTRQEEEI